MTTALNILKAARTKIAEPDAWGKGRRFYDRQRNTCCIAEAIEESAPFDFWNARIRAIKTYYAAAGLEYSHQSLTEWNDAEERTYTEVVKTLDLAIAILRG